MDRSTVNVSLPDGCTWPPIVSLTGNDRQRVKIEPTWLLTSLTRCRTVYSSVSQSLGRDLVFWLRLGFVGRSQSRKMDFKINIHRTCRENVGHLIFRKHNLIKKKSIIYLWYTIERFCGINFSLDFIISKKDVGLETPLVDNHQFSSEEKTKGRAGGSRGRNAERLFGWEQDGEDQSDGQEVFDVEKMTPERLVEGYSMNAPKDAEVEKKNAWSLPV